jgi:hypothetical protein
MPNSSHLVSVEMLLAWPALIGLQLLFDRRYGRLPLFLSYAYIAGFALQHWLGALAHAMPWNPFSDSTNTIVGFNYTTLGLACFVLGTSVTPRPRRLVARAARPTYPVSAEAGTLGQRYARLLLAGGILGFVAELTPLNGLPSVTVLISACKQLLIAGLCLKCWLAWHARNRRQLFLWLCLALALPPYTVIVTGFLSYGIGFLLTVLIFIGTFFRPRLLLVAVASVAILFGIGFFASYLKHRTTLRDAVSGNQSLETRIEAIEDMISSTTPFDPFNQMHLQAIDARLNQNELIGAAIGYVPTFRDFAWGGTIYLAALALVPRVLWPDKPITAGSMGLVSAYTGITFAEGTSVGMGQVMEFYVNFGIEGVVVGFLILGMLIRFLDIRIAERLQTSSWPQFGLWFGVGAATLQPIGQLLEITGSMAGAAVIGLLLARYSELRPAHLLGALMNSSRSRR